MTVGMEVFGKIVMFSLDPWKQATVTNRGKISTTLTAGIVVMAKQRTSLRKDLTKPKMIAWLCKLDQEEYPKNRFTKTPVAVVRDHFLAEERCAFSPPLTLPSPSIFYLLVYITSLDQSYQSLCRKHPNVPPVPHARKGNGWTDEFALVLRVMTGSGASGRILDHRTVAITVEMEEGEGNVLEPKQPLVFRSVRLDKASPVGLLDPNDYPSLAPYFNGQKDGDLAKVSVHVQRTSAHAYIHAHTCTHMHTHTHTYTHIHTHTHTYTHMHTHTHRLMRCNAKKGKSML